MLQGVPGKRELERAIEALDSRACSWGRHLALNCKGDAYVLSQNIAVQASTLLVVLASC